MASYNNNPDKTNLIKLTGSEVIAQGYVVNISSIMNTSSDLSGALKDQDEILVVRKFDDSTISPVITADESWSAYTLPNDNASGSSMYTLNGTNVTFSSTASDYTWTSAMSERDTDVALPVISASDSIYIIKRVVNENSIVTFTSGAKLSSQNLNVSAEQVLNIAQELMTYFKEFHSLNPSVGQPNGLVSLNSSGVIPSSFVDGTTLALAVANGVTGSGTAEAPLTIALNGDSLVQSGSGLSVDTQDSLASTSTTKPLSAAKGKSLQDQITTLGSGVNYRGAFNVVTTTVTASGLTNIVAGDTVSTTASGTAHSSWGAGTVVAGGLIRFNGTVWQVTGSASPILANGTVGLTASWTAGQTIVGVTESVDNNTTRLASTGFVTAQIAATPIQTLSGVYVNTASPTTNDMIFYDGDSWEPIQLENSFTAGEKVLTTGSSIKALYDVKSDMSPGDGQSLTWDNGNSRWDATTISSVANDEVVGGTADGTTDDYAAVNTALTSSSLGSTTATSNTTFATLNLRGRDYAVVDATVTTPSKLLTMPCKRNVTIKDGGIFIKYAASKDHQVLKPGTQTVKETTTTEAEYVGCNFLNVADITGFAVGDLVRIVGHPIHDIRGGDEVATLTSAYHITTIKQLSTAGTEHRMLLDDPLPTYFKVGSLVQRAGEGTDGANQIQNLMFDRVRFKDLLGTTGYLNDITPSGSATPIAITDSGTAATITVPTHTLAQGAAVLLQDFDLTSQVPKSGDVNRWSTLTSSTNSTTFGVTLGATPSASGSFGGSQAYFTQSRHNGVHIKNGHKIVFRDCTFENFNGEYAVLIENCKDVVFERCVFKNCRGTNYVCDGQVSSCIRIKASVDIKIIDCRFESCITGVFVVPGVQSALSTIQNLGSRDITITGCYMNTTTAVLCTSTVIYGMLTVDKCKIPFFNPNPNRIPLRWHSFGDNEESDFVDSSYSRSGQICIAAVRSYPLKHGGVENIRVTDCELGGKHYFGPGDADYGGYDEAANWDSNAFWGNGNGYERKVYNGSDLYNISPAYENVYANIQPDPWADPSVYQTYSLSMRNNGRHSVISGNAMCALYSNVDLFQCYNSLTDVVTAWASVRVDDNQCTGGLYNIMLSSLYGKGLYEGWSNSSISRNMINSNHQVKNVAGLWRGRPGFGNNGTAYSRNWEENDLRGIWARTSNKTSAVDGTGTAYRGLAISNNHIIGSSYDQAYDPQQFYSSQGILLGSSTANFKSNVFRNCTISDNHIRSYEYGLYSYRSADTASYSLLRQSMFNGNFISGCKKWANWSGLDWSPTNDASNALGNNYERGVV